MGRSVDKVGAPAFCEPMAARAAAQLPDTDEWTYEVKLDGYRVLALKRRGSVTLLSRKNKDLTRDFPSVVTAIDELRADSLLLDGEVVALDSEGKPSFQLLQHKRANMGAIVYYAFDLLHLDGEDLRGCTLTERRAALERVIAKSRVRLSVSFEGPIAKLIDEVRRLGLEGIVAKRRNSTYQPGKRSGAWLKLKLGPEQEFVIGGFKPPLESLIVGYYEGERFVCAGKVRQGLNPRLRSELAKALRPLLSATCPFVNLPNSKKSRWGEGITAAEMPELRWVQPRLVAQVSFTEWTVGGKLRHGTFRGLRRDKDPREVVRER